MDDDSCIFCRNGRIAWNIEEMTFRQRSDKGDIVCSVKISIGTCDICGSRTLQPQSDRMFEEAFKREYGKRR